MILVGNRKVAWPGVALSALAGQTVRFRVTLTRGRHAETRLYALYAGT